MSDEILEGGTGIGCLHEGLSDEKSTETGSAEGADGVGIRYPALADLHCIFRKQFCKAEGVLNIGDERAEVTGGKVTAKWRP